MAKRKNKGRAKPAAESQANVAEAEVRPAEPESADENPPAPAEATDDAQAATDQAQAEGASQSAEVADAPASEEPRETADAGAESVQDAPETTAQEAAAPAEGETAEAATPAEDETAAQEATAPAQDETAEAALGEEAPVAETAKDGERATTTQESASEADGETPAEDVWAEDRVAAPEGEPVSDEPSEQDSAVWAESAEGAEATNGEGEPAPTDGQGDEETPAILDSCQMESIIEGLLFASDRVLGLADLKRLLDERDGKKITAALESLSERRKGTGIEVVHLSNGWHLRTNSEHARWVSKLLAGKPMRLSRAMMETLAIVAYRQPVTRPEIDEIRGVDCGPVLKTLLDRGLIRIIGKKEDVGRPLLYGTTPEFLRVFNLRELTELPTLREYAELNSEQQAMVNAKHGPAPEGTANPEATGEASTAPAVDVTGPGPNLKFVPRGELPDEPEDNDPLLDELESATKDASKILGAASEPPPDAPAEEPATAEANAPTPAEPTNES